MTGLWLAYWESLCRSRCPQIKSYGQLVECFFWSFGSCEVTFLFVCCWYIWAIFDTFPNRCPMVPFMFDESVLSSRSWLTWFLRKMPLAMHNQLLACWMRNGCKIQKSAWTWSRWHWSRNESCSCLFAGCHWKNETVLIQMQTNYHQNPH